MWFRNVNCSARLATPTANCAGTKAAWKAETVPQGWQTDRGQSRTANCSEMKAEPVPQGGQTDR